MVLAALAALSGFVVFEGVGEALGFGSGFLGAVENVLIADVHGFEFDWAIAAISTLLVASGLAAGVYAWSGEALPAKLAGARFPLLYQIFKNKFYVDDFYQWVIDHIVLVLARFIAFFDRVAINDTGVNGPGQVASGLSFLLKFQQTGKLPNYALAMIIGVVVLIVVGFSVKG